MIFIKPTFSFEKSQIRKRVHKDIITLRVILSDSGFSKGNDIHKTQDPMKIQTLTCTMTPQGWKAGCLDIHLLHFHIPETYILNNHHSLEKKSLV